MAKGQWKDDFLKPPEDIVLKDIKICAHNYYNKLYPLKASMQLINKMVKEEVARTGLSEREGAEIVKRRLRKRYLERLKSGEIKE